MDDLTLSEGFVGQKMIVLPEQVKLTLRSNILTRFFYVTDLGYYPHAAHHFRNREHGANEYIFIYCIEGEGLLTISGKKTRVLPNHYFIIPKNISHSYESIASNPWSIYWMHFDGSAVASLIKRYELNTDKIIPIPFDGKRIDLFNQIYEIFNSGYLDFQMEYACMTSLGFINSFVYNNIYKSINMDSHENLVNSIKIFLNNNLEKSLKSTDIAKEFNYSVSYIFTIFKKSTGYSLIHFFNLKKMQKACEYINYTNLSIKEISHRLGYQDQFYFSRIFKKHLGVSPRAYKKSY